MMDRVLTNFFYIVFQFLKIRLNKRINLLFLVVFISFYISRKVFKNLIQHYLKKKDFCHKFSFFNGFAQHPAPLPPEPLSSLTAKIR